MKAAICRPKRGGGARLRGEPRLSPFLDLPFYEKAEVYRSRCGGHRDHGPAPGGKSADQIYAAGDLAIPTARTGSASKS